MPAKTKSQTAARDSNGSKVPGRALGIRTANVLKVNAMLKRGLSFGAVRRLQRFSGLSQEQIGAVAQIPRRTLARRKAQGALTPQESERIFRLTVVFEQAVELFEGDVDATRQWLSTPAKAFAKTSPLEMCETEIGAREVEKLIGRLEYGVFS